MSYRDIEKAGTKDGCSLARSTVQRFMEPIDRKVADSSSGQLSDLVDLLLSQVGDAEPTAAPWLDKTEWRCRWEQLDDADHARIDSAATRDRITKAAGVLGWDGAAEQLRLSTDTETSWLGHERLADMAAAINQLLSLGFHREAHSAAARLLHAAEQPAQAERRCAMAMSASMQSIPVTWTPLTWATVRATSPTPQPASSTADPGGRASLRAATTSMRRMAAENRQEVSAGSYQPKWRVRPRSVT
ncbi:hypothetical protein [Streptomyces sp. NPDC001415]